MLWLEQQLPEAVFESSWTEARLPWVAQVKAATDANSLAPLLLQV